MKTNREIFEHLVNTKNIYLNKYFLDRVVERLEDAYKRKSYFSELTAVENEFNINKFKNKEAKMNAAFVIDNKHNEYTKKASKAVEQYDLETGELIAEHSSLYQAAQAIGKEFGHGLISNACHGKTKQAYQFGWRFV